jgi:hypothetical protein
VEIKRGDELVCCMCGVVGIAIRDSGECEHDKHPMVCARCAGEILYHLTEICSGSQDAAEGALIVWRGHYHDTLPPDKWCRSPVLFS